MVGLSAILVLLAAAIGVPPSGPAATASGGPSASPPSASAPAVAVGYREGIVGRPASLDPLTAQTQVDRDIVSLVFSGLARLGPDGTVVPDLATGWTIADKGKSYTFTIRPDARWQDGQPVTSADVVYTIRTLQDPAYTGPGASSWREVTVTAVDDLTVRFDLATPLGDFLEAVRQPLLPAHLLGDVAVADLPTAPFNEAPIGSGPYRLISWDALSAHLEPFAESTSTASPSLSASPVPSAGSPSAGPSVASTNAGGSPRSSGSSDASARPTATPVPSPPPGSVPLPAIDLRFYADATALAADYMAGLIDAASGLSPSQAKALAAGADSRLISYPRTTYTGIVLNQRPSHPLLTSVVVRKALLQAIDRPTLITQVLDGAGQLGATLIPPSSWAFDAKAAPLVKYDTVAATKALKAAGWTKPTKGWTPPKAKTPFAIELITPDEASNPTVFATTQAVAADWRAFGFAVTVIALTPHDYVDNRLTPGKFDAAVVDIDVGLDPDLYPFLASTQTTTGGANVSGIQIPALDVKLAAARKYASPGARIAAFKDLQTYLGQNLFSLPLFFRYEQVVVRDTVWGPTPREIADPSGRFWDVLTWRLATGR